MSQSNIDLRREALHRMKEVMPEVHECYNPMAVAKYAYYQELFFQLGNQGPNTAQTLPQDPEQGIPEVPNATKPLFT